jgi:ATP-dependent DNA helicase MPH1
MLRRDLATWPGGSVHVTCTNASLIDSNAPFRFSRDTMSSPSRYWDDDELNSAVLNELAAIDTLQVASTSKPLVRKPSSDLEPTPLTVPDSDDLFDLTFDVGVQDLQRLDAAIEKDYRRKADAPSKSPSSGAGAFTARSLSGRQVTLFGDVISPRTSPSKKPPSSRRSVQQRKSPTRPVNRPTKKWDHTAFAKTGRRQRAGKGKGKENLDEEEEEVVEFEQFPAPFVPGKLIVLVSKVTYFSPI